MRYRVFGRTGLKVSSLALGTGNFGTGWGYGANRDEAKAIFDGYRHAGGNFIVTASNYQFGQAETTLGEFIGADRDDIVLATKGLAGQTRTKPSLSCPPRRFALQRRSISLQDGSGSSGVRS